MGKGIRRSTGGRCPNTFNLFNTIIIMESYGTPIRNSKKGSDATRGIALFL
jgi:hypothetical protein